MQPEALRTWLDPRLKDREWRLNNLYYITDKHGNRVKFRMNAQQRELFRRLWYRNLILKARQLGFTTFMCILMLDAALFTAHTKCGFIAHTLPDATRIFSEKIKFAYDHLPGFIRRHIPTVGRSKTELKFSNGSAIWVGTSHRGGTLQYLHISEFGKICAKFPDRALEIVTGGFPACPTGGSVITIESTAEGKEGFFYDYCQDAQKQRAEGRALSVLDWRFFFFPWYGDASYSVDPATVVVPERIEEYAAELAAKEGLTLTRGQIAWYTAQEKQLGELIKREYPATPDEAFNQAVKGAYYASQFKHIYQHKRITAVPYQPGFGVETWWDLGVDDETAICFVQRIGQEIRFIDYYEVSGEGFAHFAKVLQDKGYTYSRHIGPHDLQVRNLGETTETRLDIAARLGIRFQIAPSVGVADGIEAVRRLLPSCWFDEVKCAALVAHLELYRKEWDERLGSYRDRPLHDQHSHAADAVRYGAVAGGVVVAAKATARTVTHERRGR